MTDVKALAGQARQILAAAWGEHPQWADVRQRILDGSCSIHSDTLSLSCSIAIEAILTALRSTTEHPAADELLREARDSLAEAVRELGASAPFTPGYVAEHLVRSCAKNCRRSLARIDAFLSAKGDEA